MKAPLRFARLLVSCAGLLAVRGLAQDVTVTESVWALSDPAPEIIPKPKSRLRPDFPDEMRSTTEIGYVIVGRYADSDGKVLGNHAVATHTAFERAVEKEFPNWEMTPGKRDGKPAGGEIWLAAIFNPKSASAKGANATPRLLAVVPIIVARLPFGKQVPPIVRMRLKIDATGAITASTPEVEINEATTTAIKDGLEKWRFAPARQNGQPIAAEVVLPIVCQRPSRAEVSNFVPPKVLKREPADYPVAMKQSRLRGEVTVTFEVETDGSMKNPIVTRSNNPGFDEAALTALRKWKFQPATRDGIAVSAKSTITIIFSLYGSSPGFEAHDAYEVDSWNNSSKLPPELRYDTAAKIRGTVVPVYPYALLRERTRGSASVAIAIDVQGHVTDTRILKASSPELGLALVAALEAFSFDPALKDAKPVPSILRHSQDFSNSEPSDADPDDLVSVEKKHPEKIVRADKLDAPLRPVSQKAPVFPVSLRGKIASGRADLEILIDSAGHVRLPRVVSATNEAFGYSAVQAVSVWIFDPPKVGGKSAVTRVQVPFNFNGPPVTATATETPLLMSEEKK